MEYTISNSYMYIYIFFIQKAALFINHPREIWLSKKKKKKKKEKNFFLPRYPSSLEEISFRRRVS